jgi:hypothetical protein
VKAVLNEGKIMNKIIRDLWILYKEGMVIYHRVYYEKMDSDLLGGFISALNSFATTFDHDGLSNFTMGEKQFVMAKNQQLIFVLNCDVKIKMKDAKNELNMIMKRFFQTYSLDIINNWNGDKSTFRGFERNIEDSMAPMEKLNAGLW